MATQSTVPNLDSRGSTYHFVTYTGAPNIDPNARKLAKRNVMKHIHRNRRKALAARRRIPLQCKLEVPQAITEGNANSSERLHSFHSLAPSAPIDALINADSSSLPQVCSVTDKASTIEPLSGILTMSRLGAGRGDPFLRYPIKISPRYKELVDIIFDKRGGKASPLSAAWFQISILDAAAFHQLLSGAATYFNNLRHGDGLQASGESLAHHTYSLQLVNRQMRDVKAATNDGVISAIIGFACYYHLIGDMRSWKTHLDGLKEIIHLRGGLVTLDSNTFLRIMLSCIDISGSCTLDETPKFPLPVNPMPAIQPSLPFSALDSSYHHNIDILLFNCTNNLALIEILIDLIQESSHLQDEIQRTKGDILSDSMYICNHTNPLLHRLLSLPRHKDTSAVPDVAETIRLAAILYLIAIRQAFGIYPTRVTRQIRKLSVLLITIESNGAERNMWADRGLGCLQLWIITVGGILCDDRDRTAWFAKCLHTAMRRMSVATYGDLEDMLKGFSWIDEIHGTLLKVFRSKLIT
ncbi:fungal-specific transcription factor domain-containing protein [Cadophora sp. MPI-SDFR-AT-0126]|nr:fungal-specific transcription factor domain-containing protein [Leotiomycetes sp. MPI-SDFR-AT-0126]